MIRSSLLSYSSAFSVGRTDDVITLSTGEPESRLSAWSDAHSTG